MSTALRQLFALGAPLQPGVFVGTFRIGDGLFGLVVGPKVEGESSKPWNDREVDVPGACSFNDGLANTDAMAEAGSALAQWARSLRIGGRDDWYIPSRDELEMLYRNLKPTERENHVYRAGDNPSSVPAGYPYTEQSPAQTIVEAFREGGAEALEPTWYWSSTQRSRGNAWYQYFSTGGQLGTDKSWEARCRVVRRFAIE